MWHYIVLSQLRLFVRRSYDSEGKGHITHQDFLQRLSGDQFAPSDQQGMSQQIIAKSYAGLEQHHRNQQAKHEQITLNQAYSSVNMAVSQVLQQLRSVSHAYFYLYLSLTLAPARR